MHRPVEHVLTLSWGCSLALDHVPPEEHLRFVPRLDNKDELVNLFRELNFACFWDDLEDIYQCSFTRSETNTRLSKRDLLKTRVSPFAGAHLR